MSTASNDLSADSSNEQTAVKVVRRKAGVPAQIGSAAGVPAQIGSAAGVLLATVGLFGSAGPVWGWKRPTLHGVVTEDGLEIANTLGSPEFVTWGWFVLGTSLCALILAIGTFLFAKSRRGVFMQFWVMLCALAGAWLFYQVGTAFALELTPIPAGNSLNMGAEIDFVPAVQPSVGMIAAPFVALFSYWWATVLSNPDEAESIDVVAKGGGHVAGGHTASGSNDPSGAQSVVGN